MIYQVNFLALDIKRWILEHRKINSIASLLIGEEEKQLQFDFSILKPHEMLENFMAKLHNEISSRLLPTNGSTKTVVEFENPSFLRQQLLSYFKKIAIELRGGKGNNNENNHRGIRTTHFDVYPEDSDISSLPEHAKFYVVLNWCRNYYDREEYKKAIDPLQKLLKLNPQFGLGYKWLARSQKKIRKYEEAMSNYQRYAEVDGSVEAYLDLAKSYRKGKIFDKSEEIYTDLLMSDPKNKEAQIGLAQIKFAVRQPEYLQLLDKLFKQDPAWLKKWLVEEFNFRVYVPEKTFITPSQAAKFLGFDQVFQLTERAFKNELPSHFNPAKARMSFYKEELEQWAEVMNRFRCLDKKVELHPEHIDDKRSIKMARDEDVSSKKSDESSSKKLEQMLKEIREMKARRAAHQIGSATSKRQNHVKKPVKKPSNQNEDGERAKRPKQHIKEKSLREADR